MRSELQSIAALAIGGLLVALGVASCTQEDALVARGGPDASSEVPGPIFVPPDGSADAASDVANPSRLLCVATECSAPYATCGAGFPCDTNLSNDEFHCGACNNRCPVFAPLFMRARCIDGACALECFSNSESGQDFRNCNGTVDDGCEVNVVEDPKHCGTCGHACAAGERCRDGRCGCPAPMVECGGLCVDLANDALHCGACGTRCAIPADACTTLPPQTNYGCSAGQCGKLVCDTGSADCNHDLGSGCASDGCESTLQDDANCGACGNACPAGTECRAEGASVACLPICNSPECQCKPGETLCPNGSCVDLLHDVGNCGACLAKCPRAYESQVASCEKGVCESSCASGYADCNGNPADGCEVDLVRDPRNCGVCGGRCDTAAGQPCIEGRCLMRECAPGETN